MGAIGAASSRQRMAASRTSTRKRYACGERQRVGDVLNSRGLPAGPLLDLHGREYRRNGVPTPGLVEVEPNGAVYVYGATDDRFVSLDGLTFEAGS